MEQVKKLIFFIFCFICQIGSQTSFLSNKIKVVSSSWILSAQNYSRNQFPVAMCQSSYRPLSKIDDHEQLTCNLTSFSPLFLVEDKNNRVIINIQEKIITLSPLYKKNFIYKFKNFKNMFLFIFIFKIKFNTMTYWLNYTGKIKAIYHFIIFYK